MKAIVTIFGAGAAIPRTIFGANLITTGAIKFVLWKIGDVVYKLYKLSAA